MNDTNTENNIAARDSLVLPEGKNKPFYYSLRLDAEITNPALTELSTDRSLSIDNIQRCEFKILHHNFDGKQDINSLVIFDRTGAENSLETSIGAMDCLMKIPKNLIDEYRLFLPN